MQPFKLIQISDCHLPESANTLYRGERVWEKLESMIKSAAKWSPDAVVVTGDISEESGPESYRFFQETLTTLKRPVYCLSGNHDPRTTLAKTLSEPLSMPDSVAQGNWRLHFIDSASHQRIHGELSQTQIDNLALGIDQQTEDWALVFLHHQPIACGSHWIDRYPLHNPQALLELVEKRSKIRAVCWGHIHHEWQQLRQHCLYLGCPSTAYSVLANQVAPIKDPRGPACRWLELSANGEFKTGILYAYDDSQA